MLPLAHIASRSPLASRIAPLQAAVSPPRNYSRALAITVSHTANVLLLQLPLSAARAQIRECACIELDARAHCG